MRSLLVKVIGWGALGLSLGWGAGGCQPSPDPVTRPAKPLDRTTAEMAWTVTAAGQTIPYDQVWPSLFGPFESSEVAAAFDGQWLGSPQQHVVWRKNLGTGYSSPVIAKDRVIVLDRVGDEERLQAFSLVDGAPLWQVTWPSSFVCPYEYSNGPASTPLLAQDRVYALGAEGHLCCVELQSGELLWQRDLRQESELDVGPFGLGASPQWIDNKIVVQVGPGDSVGCLRALDPDTGQTLWSCVNHPASCSTPIRWSLAGREDIICLTDAGLVAVRGDNGELLGELPFRSKISLQVNATTPVRIGESLRICAYGMGTAAVQVDATGELTLAWRQKRSLDSQYNNLVFTQDGLVGFSARSHQLMCIDVDSGELNWEVDCPVGRGNQLRTGEQLVVFGEDGRVAVFSLRESPPRLLTSSEESLLEGRCFSMPAVAAGHLILKSDGEIVCLRIPAGSHSLNP